LADNGDLKRKILVAGQGGKSTLALALALALATDLDLPYIELDAISWLPNWVERPKDDFREQVRKALEENPDGWVIDGNYGTELQGMVAQQAETVVYVNMPWLLMYWQVLLRSFKRVRDKRVICGENVETWREAFFSSDSLLWFLITNRRSITQRRPARLRAWAEGAQFIELGSRKELNGFYKERGLLRDD
jgi:adenylate kinase family enzyme